MTRVGQSRDRDHLPLPHRERERPETATLQVAHGQHVRLRRGMGIDRHGRHLAAHDQRHQLGLRESLDLSGRHGPAVADHADPVADPHDLVDAMGDQHDGDALGSEAPQDREQVAHGPGVQAGGRLVQHQQPGVRGHRPRDRHLGPQSDRQVGDLGVHVEFDAHASQRAPGSGAQLVAVDAAPAGGEPGGQRHVLRDGECAHEAVLLVDEGAAAPGDRFGTEAGREHLAEQLHRARVGDLHTGGDLDERGLPRAVLAQQPVDLAGEDLEVGLGQRDRAAVDLRHAAEAARDRPDPFRAPSCRGHLCGPLRPSRCPRAPGTRPGSRPRRRTSGPGPGRSARCRRRTAAHRCRDPGHRGTVRP